MQLLGYSLFPNQKGTSREGCRPDNEQRLDSGRDAERTSDGDREPAPTVENEEEPEGYGFGV